MKEINQASRTCEKCKKYFENKQDFYNHLPCKYKCHCGKRFPSQWRFNRHLNSCDDSKQNKTSASSIKSDFHNVISYKCFICQLGGIKCEDVREHIETIHSCISEPIRCDPCDVDVHSLFDHICDNHVTIRRLRKIPVQPQPVTSEGRNPVTSKGGNPVTSD